MANSLNTITVNGVTYDADTYSAASKTSTSSTSSIASAASENALGKDAFLQLLVTQMQYQDPLDPQDNSQYLSQLAQFSALEQMTNVAEGLTKVSSLVSNIDTSVLVGQLSGMIDKDVQWKATTTVTDADGVAVLDKDGNAQTTSQTFEGIVKAVSIANGQPTIVAEADGKTYQVAISDISRIGKA